MRHLENLFKANPKPRKGFVPLMACMDTFLEYDLPEYIRYQCYYVNTVLVSEAVPKIIMDLEKCSCEMATGIGLGIIVPTKTLYGIEWDSLVEETVMVSLKLEMKVSLPPELLHAQSRRSSQYRFTVPLIVPSYSYSCGLRALTEAVNNVRGS